MTVFTYFLRVNNLVFGLVSGKVALFWLRGVTKYPSLLHFRIFSEALSMVRPEKYGKSKRQREKEKARQERVYELVTGDRGVKIDEMAEELGVSVSTVTRDKRKLRCRLRKWRIEVALSLLRRPPDPRAEG